MSAEHVIELVNNAGLTLAAKNGQLFVNGIGDKNSANAKLRELLVKWKPQLISSLTYKMFVLDLIVDGKGVTCIDPVSLTLHEAYSNQRERWGERLTRISHKPTDKSPNLI